MHHFFVTTDQIDGTYCHILGQDVNHIRDVLRMKAGETITVRDGISRSYLCQIDMLGAKEVTAKILAVQDDNRELSSKLYLFQALPKKDKMEFVIQKAVELGAYEIIPVAARRCVVKLDAKRAEAKKKRWNAVAESAAKQSGRTRIPQVTQVMDWKQALEYAGNFDFNLIPYELAKGIADTKAMLAQAKPDMQIGVFIGPEGGFDTEEVEAAVAAGVHPITLGRRILRTETAGIVALSILMFHLER